METSSRSPEVYEFGPFRLDVRERLLLRAGEPVPLRAKVLDTLAVLVRNAGKLVERGDLLEAVWPRSIVEESNLSHNVSALRRVLRAEDGKKYIETVPRRGYRFVGSVEVVPAAASGPRPAASDLDGARRAFEQGAWADAYERFQSAGGAEVLAAADQVSLARAARWSGRFDELVPLLEGAAAAFRREGDGVGAARTAIELAITLLERRRPALASSHVRQAERTLPESAEPGTPAAEAVAYLAWARSRLAWADGDWEAAAERAREVLALSRDLQVKDTEALALMDMGHALLVQHRYGEAAGPLEEAGAVTMGGELGLYAAGTVLCGLIFAWRACGRLELASEWTDAFSRWSDREGVGYFPGLCRVHRGELICLRGDLAEAEEDLRRGTLELATANSMHAAVGFRELGVVRLRRGDLAGAEEAFLRAIEFGIEPEPGLARLRAARGEVEDAYRGLSRFLAGDGETPPTLFDRENRVLALVALVPLALAIGEVEGARRAAAELRTIADRCGSPMHGAAADQAEGQMLLHEGRPGALELLCRGVRAWSEIDAPYECALAREDLARAYLLEEDESRARMELLAAGSTFERLAAELDRRRVAHRLEGLVPGSPQKPVGRRVLVRGQVVDADGLRSVIGEEAWKDLEGWLERRLHDCWSDHGGKAIDVPEGYAVSFDRIADSLRCARHVQRSLREHRARHGFAPPLRVGVVDTGVLPCDLDQGTALDLARRVADAGNAGDVTIVTSPEDAPDLSGVDAVHRRVSFRGTDLDAFVLPGGEPSA